MRVLIISHSYFPANEPRAFRWTEIAEMFVKMGHEVDVLTVSNKRKLACLSRKNGTKIIRVFDPIHSVSHGKPKSKERPPSSAARFSITGIISKVLLLIRWPDYAWFWILPAVFVGRKLLRRRKYDAVISVSNPFSSHVVAYMLLRKKSDIVWVCDYGDPFSFESSYPSNNQKLYRNLNFSFEKKVIAISRKISVTNAAVIIKFQECFKLPRILYRVIPPFLNVLPKDFALNNYNENFDREAINIVYSGVLYSKIRNPSFLLELILQLKDRFLGKKIKMHFFGAVGDCENIFAQYSSGLDQWLFIHGSIERNLLQSYLANADFLVNIGNKSSFQLPSKIFEYISTNLPILNIVSSDDDLTIPILKEYNSSLTLYSEHTLSKSVVEKTVDFIRSPSPINHSFVNKILHENSSSAISRQYLEFISEQVNVSDKELGI
jgi:hypothetical protein